MTEKGPIQCLWPDCERVGTSRQLCPRHYFQARQSVLQGQTTWAALEAAGHCQKAQTYFQRRVR